VIRNLIDFARESQQQRGAVADPAAKYPVSEKESVRAIHLAIGHGLRGCQRLFDAGCGDDWPDKYTLNYTAPETVFQKSDFLEPASPPQGGSGNSQPEPVSLMAR
jgi:hypothetical protein